MTKKKEIFISYKREVKPDEPIAIHVHNYFREKYNVFIDQRLVVGTDWAKQIRNQLRKTDFLLCFISKDSVNSEMVLEEIQIANRLYKKNKKPVILPIRLNYQDNLAYPLGAYLNSVQYFLWEDDTDTAEMINQLELAISGQNLSNKKIVKKAKTKVKRTIQEPTPAAFPITYETPSGAMDHHSKFYIERNGDKRAIEAVQEMYDWVTIKGPRQMGKSTLLNRIVESATETGKRTVLLDFQLIEEATLTDPQNFYPHLCKWISFELGLPDKVNQYWKLPLGNTQICTKYIKEQVLRSIEQPLLIAMDEVDKMFETNFRLDFFGMLRSWYNKRAKEMEWKNLTLALVTSTEPYLFVPTINQSPFNVGEKVNVEDFTPEQVTDLNHRHGKPLSDEGEMDILNLIGGHPYLTRKCLYLIATKKVSFEKLMKKAADDDGPFGDHLRGYIFRLQENKELLKGLSMVMKSKICPDEEIYFRLHGAGLVRRDGKLTVFRNHIYEKYFGKRLNG